MIPVTGITAINSGSENSRSDNPPPHLIAQPSASCRKLLRENAAGEFATCRAMWVAVLAAVLSDYRDEYRHLEMVARRNWPQPHGTDRRKPDAVLEDMRRYLESSNGQLVAALAGRENISFRAAKRWVTADNVKKR